MPNRIPDSFDPRDFVEKRRLIQAELPFDRLARVQDALADTAGVARVELRFEKWGRVAGIDGRVDAELRLRCQRCLDALEWPVHCDVRLGIVGSIDEANLLPDDVEPLLLAPGATIDLAELVEDELLLAIPSIPRHIDCQVPGSAGRPQEKDKPFAVLANLTKPTEE